MSMPAASQRSGSGPEADYNRKRLPAVEVFLPVNVAVMTRRNIERQSVAVMDHYPVAPDIHPTFVRVASDRHVGCAQVSTAVGFVPVGNR